MGHRIQSSILSCNYSYRWVGRFAYFASEFLATELGLHVARGMLVSCKTPLGNGHL
jgi:hypothetical protein